MVMVPNTISWIYDFSRSKKMTSNPEIIPILNVLAPPATGATQDFKSLIINKCNIYVMMTSRRPNVNCTGKLVETPKKASSVVDTQRIII